MAILTAYCRALAKVDEINPMPMPVIAPFFSAKGRGIILYGGSENIYSITTFRT
jgi:hypothetical protein